MDDENKKYCAYDFKNLQRLAEPIKVDAEKHICVEIPNDLEKYYSNILFK